MYLGASIQSTKPHAKKKTNKQKTQFIWANKLYMQLCAISINNWDFIDLMPQMYLLVHSVNREL